MTLTKPNNPAVGKRKGKIPPPLSFKLAFSKRPSASSSTSTPTASPSGPSSQAFRSLPASPFRTARERAAANAKAGRRPASQRAIRPSSSLKAPPPSPASPVPASPKPRRSSLGVFSHRSKTPLPESHPAFGMAPLQVPDSMPNLMSPTTTLSSSTVAPSTSGSPTESTPPTSASLVNSDGWAVPSKPPKENECLPKLNPNMPSYLLDIIHPCIPLPPSWNSQHDKYIVMLDIQDYHYAAMVSRVKKRFPILQDAVLTPAMMEKRIRILDEDPYCDYFKWAVAINEASVGSEYKTRVEERGFMEAISEADGGGEADGGIMTAARAGPSDAPQKANDTKKIIPPDRRARSVSTGGMSGKIVIARGKATVVNTHPANSPLSSTHTSPVNSRSSSPLGPRPQTSPLVNAGPPRAERAVSPRLTTEGRPGGGLAHSGKGKKIVKPARHENAREASDAGAAFGVPSVMRTSSGRPVLR